MVCLVTKLGRLVGVLVSLAFVLSTGSALAATFDIFKAGSSEKLGTFEAPAGGGTVSTMTVTVSGYTFDVLGTGTQAPVYNLANNDLGGTGSSLGAIFNSTASGICGIGECVFSVYTIYDSMIPDAWYVDKVLPPGQHQSIDLGYYDIEVSAIPLPSSIMLFGTALIGLIFIRRSTRRHPHRATGRGVQPASQTHG